MPPSPSPDSPSSHVRHSHWDPLVIALVGAICAIFLLLSYHRILHQHCCAFQVITFSRNQDQRHRLNENNPDDPSLQFQNQGLDSYITRSLPVIQYEKKSEEDTNGRDADCAVCLGEFEEGEWLKRLPNCCHVFHVSCIDTWFQSHSSCPLCRSDIFDVEYSVSAYTLQETLTMEEMQQERSSLYQVLRTHVLQGPSLRPEREHSS